MYEIDKERLCATIIDSRQNLDKSLDSIVLNDMDAAIFEINAVQFRLNSAIKLIKQTKNVDLFEVRRQWASN